MTVGVDIKINQDACIKCKTCVKTCYQNVYRLNKDLGQIEAAFPEDCVSCLMCAMNCPKQCIEIVPLPVHRFDPLVGA